MKLEKKYKNIHGCLSLKEWHELVGLEYILTWGYSKNIAQDEKRYKELSKKRFNSLYC